MRRALALAIASEMLVVAIALVMALSAARAGEFRVTPVANYCNSADVFHRAIEAHKSHGGEAGVAVLNMALAAGECTRLPRHRAVPFLATGIARAYRHGVSGAEVVLEGVLSGGETVYVWIDAVDLGHYKAGEGI